MGLDRPICVIGAGVAGLLATRRLVDEGFAVEVIERRAGLGGLWNRDPRYGGVYRSAHLISSRYSTELADFPMPEHFPDYPSHAQALEYLQRLAQHYDLTRHITFGRQVLQAQPLIDGGWEVVFDDETRRDYAALVIATGHHWDPALPPISTAAFDGTTMHAVDYHTPDVLADRRVLVVGLGNTACDVAVDAVYAGAEVLLSVRGGNQIIPKYVLGGPVDQLSKGGLRGWVTSRLPAGLRSAIDSRVLGTLGGKPENFGLPRPTHRLYERQPLVNSLLPYHLGHGDIQVKSPVAGLTGAKATFADGSEEKVDLVVWCTGYRVSLPFVDVRAHLNGDPQGRPRLWLNMFHPDRDDVAVVGMIDPLGSWSTLDVQARLAARHLATALAKGSPGSALRAVARFSGPDLGSGPDRDWLFRDRSYTKQLRQYLSRVAAPGR